MSIAVLASADPGVVIGQAGGLLAGDPVGHNAVGTKLADAIRYGEPGRYWIGLVDGVPAGLAVQQPTNTPLAVAPMPAELVAAIADAVYTGDVPLPGVSGPAETAWRFAAVWGRLRKLATVPTSESGSTRFVTRRLAAGDVWIWDDDGPVSMAARAETVAGVSTSGSDTRPSAMCAATSLVSGAWPTVVRHETIGIMTLSELGSEPAKATSGWAAWLTNPRVLILAVAVLVLTNVLLTRYESVGPPDYFWGSLGVLLAVWQLWNRRPLAWALLTAATAAALPIYGLSVAGVINYVQPGWWMLITGAADILALAILLSPPIRRWVAKQPALVP